MRSTPDTVTGKIRREQCLEMRIQGHSYREIGIALGITTPAAYQHVKKALHEIDKSTKEKAEELRQIELLRLDEMERGLWERAKAADDKAVLSVMRIMERRAKLYGLDAPVAIEGTIRTVTEDDRSAVVEYLVGRTLASLDR